MLLVLEFKGKYYEGVICLIAVDLCLAMLIHLFYAKTAV
jgi:hypothetical protein